MNNLLILSVSVVLPLTLLILRRSPATHQDEQSSDTVDQRVWTTKEILTTSMF